MNIKFKNILLVILFILFIIIIYNSCYVDNFISIKNNIILNKNNFIIYPIRESKLYNLNNLRNIYKKFRTDALIYVKFDPSTIKIETELNLPNIYVQNTSECRGCVKDKSGNALSEKLLVNIRNIIKLLLDNLNSTVICNETQIIDYKNNLKDIIIYLSTNNAYTKTYNLHIYKNYQGQLFLNFSYLPVFLQAYIISYNIFNNNQKNIVNKYIKSIYLLIRNEMMKRPNNWKIGFGRNSILCGYILNDKKIYNDGIDIFEYACKEIDINSGLFLTEMTRGNLNFVYNIKTANFVCDLYYFIKNTSNINFNNNIFDYIKSFSNVIASTAFKNTVKKIIIEDNIYEQYAKMKQENVRKGLLNFLLYDFVYKQLNDENKKNIDNLMLDNSVAFNPFLIGP